MERGVDRLLSLAGNDGFECEVYAERVRRFQVEVFRGEVESVDRSVDEGFALRLVRHGRVGAAFTTATGADGLFAVYAEARGNVRAASPVDADVLADFREAPARAGLFPRLPGEKDARIALDGVREMEAACYGTDDRVENTEGALYAEEVEEVLVAGTRGFLCRETRGMCSCSIAAVARTGGETRTGWHHGQAHHPSDLDFAGIGREAAVKSVDLLGSRPVATKRCGVVLDAPAAADIVGLLEQALSAESVVRGMSVLAGMLGGRIAPAGVSVVDDPFLPGGCYNASFDAEGLPKNRAVLVRDGVLEQYLHTAYSANRMGVEATGNAVRASWKSLPVPGPANLCLEPGGATLQDLLAAAGEGIFVRDIMGMHTADPISGDFSVGINGRLIRGGAFAGPVSEMTLSGNLSKLLAGIRGVGRERTFIGPYGAPPLFVEGLTVSGT
ncbi:MAG: TldD/PmbA family protein [Candidatus Krumholzibacteriota bacterium]|nr:TldD/PmbA family protein [Candidatus Krumholzibacteriota bacterium]